MTHDRSALDAALEEAGVDGYLVDAASDDSDQFSLSGFDAPDPFLTLYDGNDVRLLFARSLEYARAVEESDATTVQRYVDFDHGERGSNGPFFPTYRDPDHEERYGYVCGNCEGLDVAVDTMDRLECLDCGNRRKPARWDAAYL